MANLKIVFFASLRETLQCDELEQNIDAPISVAELKALLAKELNQPLLLTDKVKAAIDFDFARDDDVIDINTVKEIAFFPPVTGG